jgi:hypothetical protein
MIQTKRDTPVLREQGVGRAAGDRILEKIYIAAKAQSRQKPTKGCSAE